MTEKDAIRIAEQRFGKDSFAEYDVPEEGRRYYVGPCPKRPGPYIGYMGFSWEEAFLAADSAWPVKEKG